MSAIGISYDPELGAGRLEVYVPGLDTDDAWGYTFNGHLHLALTDREFLELYATLHQRFGPRYQEMQAALVTNPGTQDDGDQGPYGTDDPKHPRYHETQAALYDDREKT